MGGATAILYLSDYIPPPKVNVLVLDSPYADFQSSVNKVFRDLNGCNDDINQKVTVKVKKLLGVDLMTDLVPLNSMHKVSIPTLFIHGKMDTLVLPENSE